MSDNVCQYYLCDNSKRKCPDVRFFKFPINDDNRLEEWIINCGKYIYICMFTISNYMQQSDERYKLNQKNLCTSTYIHIKLNQLLLQYANLLL